MNNVVFITLLFLLVFTIFKWENIKRYIFDVMKICHDSSSKQCPCSSNKSRITTNVKDVEYVENYKKSNIEDYGNKIMENIGYFIASNDEKKGQTYYPTPLQDIDPNELA